jgi:hypothetical protein
VAETKPKELSSLRQPKAKKTLGLSVPPALRMPHEDLIHPETTPVPEYRSTGVPESGNVIAREQVSDELPKYSGTAVPEYTTPVPQSSFYRKPNEASDALDRQLSAAESKVFDQLYRLIQGFNLAERQIRIEVLRQRTGYNSDKTIRSALAGLEAKGVIARSGHRNSPGGEVFRILSYSGTPVLQYRSTPVKSTPVLESKFTGVLNTDLKDNLNDDDEAYASLLSNLRGAVKELTGRDSPPTDAERWGELAQLLVTELKIAAGRTDAVSSVPAFLTEHLRRRLWKREKREVEAEGVGKSEEQRASVDGSGCPDCFGTGMWYPEGFDKGVARCTHEKLTPTEGEKNQ